MPPAVEVQNLNHWNLQGSLQGNVFLFFLILPALCSGQQLSMHSTLNLCPLAAPYPNALLTPHHLSLISISPGISLKSSCLEAPQTALSSEAVTSHVSARLESEQVLNLTVLMSHLSTGLGMSNTLKNLNSHWKLANSSYSHFCS